MLLFVFFSCMKIASCDIYRNLTFALHIIIINKHDERESGDNNKKSGTSSSKFAAEHEKL